MELASAKRRALRSDGIWSVTRRLARRVCEVHAEGRPGVVRCTRGEDDQKPPGQLRVRKKSSSMVDRPLDLR